MILGIGIDTGGTYTDAVIYNFDKKEVIAKGKTLTTKENLEIGIGNAIDALPIDLVRQASVLSLSTTLATNACVEKKGGRAKLILIGSSQQVLESIDAKMVYGLKSEEVFCIDNKNTFDGKIVEQPAWDVIMEEEHPWFFDAQALAVAQVNALRNGALGEKVAKEKLTAKYKVPFVMASELADELNVMERGATALLNARLLPIIEEFMAAVQIALEKRQLHIKEMIVRSDGSLMSDKMALIHPVKTILSGPAASIIGGRGLTDCPNSLIVDMGGTTTDISIVKTNKPAMTDGIQIGGFRTQIKGVFIDTFGLGGDSRITIEKNKVVLHTRRVQPLCVAAMECPQMKENLFALLESNKTSSWPLHEFLYLIKKLPASHHYNEEEVKLIEKLKDGPIMLGSGKLDLYKLKSERLEAEGIIMRCGLTPTDIMHIKGDFDCFDKTVSVLGAKYFLNMLSEYKNTEEELLRFCEDIYDVVCKKLYENIVRILLINKYPKMFEKGMNEQLMDIIRQSFEEGSTKDFSTKEFFGLHFDTKATLIGIGAPTHIFLPKVAKALGTDYVIPPHAEVANAVGAIVADISVEVKVKITPIYIASGIMGYTVYWGDGKQEFETLELAIAFAQQEAQNAAIIKAKKRGALGELKVETQVNPVTAYAKDGVSIDMGTTVIANVTGRV